MTKINESIKEPRLCSYSNIMNNGEYLPQGLAIKINDYLKSPLNSKQHLIILHEYRHFLDDTTTFFGIQSFLLFWTTIFSVIKINEGASKIILPINQTGYAGTPESRSWVNWYKNVYGDSNYNESIPSCISNTEFKEDLTVSYTYESKSCNIPIPSCTLTVKQGKGSFCFKFGALCVLESLAALREDTLIEHSEDIQLESPLKGFCYRVLQYIAEHFGEKNGKTSIDRKTLVKIADRSLMTIAPGFFAVRYVEEQTAHPQQSVDETVNIVNSKYPYKYEPLVSSVLTDLKNLADKFSITPMKKEIFRWFINHIETSLAKRSSEPDIFIRPLLSDNPWEECTKLLKNCIYSAYFHPLSLRASKIRQFTTE